MSIRVLGWVAGGLVVAIVLAGSGWGLSHPSAANVSTIRAGELAPRLSIETFEGHVLSLDGFRGRPVVLNFWASWCVPCREEAPILAAAAAAHPDLQFLGANFKDAPQPAKDFQTEVGSPYPVGPIVRGSYTAFGVTAPPETFFIDRRGRLVSREVGALDTKRLAVYLSQVGL